MEEKQGKKKKGKNLRLIELIVGKIEGGKNENSPCALPLVSIGYVWVCLW